uniref:Max dimerization protein 4 n=1 Tax=Bos mutus grunniens TaxID=30521 RepID=A0A8B9XUR9_BOSMU
MALSGPIGARRLLNMHAGLQSAGAGAGPPRAVAKLGLLNCYYRGGPIGAELRSCQHSRPRLRRAAGSHWPRLDPGPAPAARAPAPICCAGRRSPLCVNLRAARRRGGSRALGESAGVWGSGAAGRAGRAASGAGRAAAAAVPKRSRRGRAGGRMELNSLLILLEAAEYLERRDREAEHGYASVLPFDGDFARKKTKAAGLVRKAPNNRALQASGTRGELQEGSGPSVCPGCPSSAASVCEGQATRPLAKGLWPPLTPLTSPHTMS